METSEDFQARMEAKSAQARYFAQLDVDAAASQVIARRRGWRPAGPALKTKAKRPQKVEGEQRRKNPAATGWTEPVPCTGGCERMVRPHFTTLEDHPGTVTPQRYAMCVTCAKGGRKRFPPPSHCRGCGAPLFVRATPVSERPEGSKRHLGRGHGSCCNRTTTVA
jgi:hypothetical protein